MVTAILVIVIVSLLWHTITYLAMLNAIEEVERKSEIFHDKETLRLLSAIYNKDEISRRLERGEEVEI